MRSERKAGSRRWSARTRRNFALGMLFISPWILGFLFFTLYPMASSLYISFTEHHVRRPSEWIGLTNYVNLFQDRRFWTSLYNTSYMVVVAVPLMLFCSFACAVLLNLKLRGQSVYRVIYYLPSIVPIVASSMLWIWIFNTNNGILNVALGYLGITGPSWLTDPAWAKSALIVMGLWGMGDTIVIYLSGLQDVPVSLLEAAQLDGASWLQRLWHVTIPLVSPITLFNLILGVIGMFQYFTQAYIFSSSQPGTANSLGSPLDSTLFYSVYLYDRFGNLKMGYAAAMAWILFIVILVCTLLLMRTSERWTHYGGEA
ncbi:MAG: sugar ABC transporter permease [Anaerolineae bacterium]|jgi:multiple sugar transport system permease protein|nr:sugar ABC transporter permease [Anaerolineae bacterium]